MLYYITQYVISTHRCFKLESFTRSLRFIVKCCTPQSFSSLHTLARPLRSAPYKTGSYRIFGLVVLTALSSAAEARIVIISSVLHCSKQENPQW
eukprot:7618-Heterococcus_DN1.PRE.3